MKWIKTDGEKLILDDGKDILLKGMGLGGWLLPEGYMWKFYNDCDRPRKMEQLIIDQCGNEYAKKFWIEYRDKYITKEDIKRIKSGGFNCVRLPMNSRILYRIKNDIMQFVSEEIARIDSLVNWCQENELYVILDMHGAPGGQTGTNIDDSEMNLPELFMNQKNEDELVCLWGMIAERYAFDSVVAGYDLLNEPLPNWFSEHNSKVMPLYCRIIKEIQKFDNKHLIILEGVHWATDFSVFDIWPDELKTVQIVLQFHKYWNNPDRESIEYYVNYRKRLQVPLFMGEGGENHPHWYTGMFGMLERENVSYCFWSYKKMETSNSPVSFPSPKNWCHMIEAVKNNEILQPHEAEKIWDDFLSCLQNSWYNENVVNAILRKAPISMPTEYYSGFESSNKRDRGAKIRLDDSITILYQDDPEKEAVPDYKRYGGEEQPEQELLFIRLKDGDTVWYDINAEETEYQIFIDARAAQSPDDTDSQLTVEIENEHKILIKCISPDIDWKLLKISDVSKFGGNLKIIFTAKGTIDIRFISIIPSIFV